MITIYKITICSALGFSLLLSAQNTEKDLPLSWRQTVHNYVGEVKQAMVEDPQAAKSYLINRANLASGLFIPFVVEIGFDIAKITTVSCYVGNTIELFVHTALGDYLNIPAITILNVLFSVATLARINLMNTAGTNLSLSLNDDVITTIQEWHNFSLTTRGKIWITGIYFALLMFHTALPSILYHSSLFTVEKLHTATASPDMTVDDLVEQLAILLDDNQFDDAYGLVENNQGACANLSNDQ